MSFPVDADSVLPVPGPVVKDTKHALNLSSSQLRKGIFWNLPHLSNLLHCTSALHPKVRISSDEQISDALDYGGADLQIRKLILVAKHAGHMAHWHTAPGPSTSPRRPTLRPVDALQFLMATAHSFSQEVPSRCSFQTLHFKRHSW